jgi:serine/threonine-protein kinase
MGVVVAALHVQLGQRVAIKFMLGQGLHDPNAVERFLREARAAAALTSEHVARVLDVGTFETGGPYMVMEYLAGIDLGQVLRRDGPLPIELAVGLVLQACEAIAEAHSLGIIHRDLKPANLFATSRLDGSPLVKVLDFGIAKAAQGASGEDQSLTASGVAMGSPGYMSPEQVRSSKDVDARSDVWSLGVILYELLTGLSPFVGETLGDTFAKIVSESPPPIRERRPDVPAKLVATIEQCLQRRVDARIQNVGALVSRLVEFASPEAAVVAARIARASGAGSPRQETLAAPPSAGFDSAADASPRRVETGPAWLRSATGQHTASVRVIAALLGVTILCASLVTYWALSRARTGAASVGSPPPPAFEAASMGPSAVAAPRLTEADPQKVRQPRLDPDARQPSEANAAKSPGIDGGPQASAHAVSAAAGSAVIMPPSRPDARKAAPPKPHNNDPDLL